MNVQELKISFYPFYQMAMEQLLNELDDLAKKCMEFNDFNKYGDFEKVLLEVSVLHADMEHAITLQKNELETCMTKDMIAERANQKSDAATERIVAIRFLDQSNIVKEQDAFVKSVAKKISAYTKWSKYLDTFFFREYDKSKGKSLNM